MNKSAAAVVEQAGIYAAVFDRVSVALPRDTSSAAPIRLLDQSELLRADAELSRLIRLAEAERVLLAGEMIRRSDPRDETSLAKRMGTTGAADLLAQTSRMPREQAGTICALARAVRPNEDLQGTPLPADRPHLAAALAAGAVDVQVAAAIARTIAKVQGGVTPVELEELEAQVVAKAQEEYTADEFLIWLRRVPDFADPDGVGRRDKESVAAAQVTKRRLDSGLTRWTLDLDALTSGLFETALDANTSRRRFSIELGDGARRDDKDLRPERQRRVDGVHRIASTVLKLDEGHVAGTAVTLLVSMTEEALRTGVGTATLLDCQDTIPAATARMLAAEAEIIPLVLGGASQPLDLGTGRRFFTEAQRRAMAVRDGGCVGPCCDAPLSWCDAAHRRPAGYGPTSIENGLLLCWRCHTLLDLHGWQVDREDDAWWWTPPPWIDPTGRRRPGGRIPPLDAAA